ncbi:Clp protease N-terminal domain-containing protein [Rhodococcus sp. T2V]|uniref:Clp protease N-terminal domain-containing protein n=1 Tax=Rhodococcus sp. T2V TaxID=3034164 RepID=UPI0023E25740|nr:Clp protease N-terminal domain-containing protein [Rhodococcus sp. T2V]MDF3311913.1 Clp protease N-terminal domain-containing protein [Rhodococcus sp. T2V]
MKQTPRAPVDPHPRRRHSPRRHSHITNRGHVITPGHSTITPASADVVDATHNHLRPEWAAGNSAVNRVARGDAWRGSASWCSRDSPIKPVRWSSSPPAPPAPTTRTGVGTEHLLVGIFDAGGPGATALTSWVSRRHSTASSRASAPRRAPPRPPGTSCSPAKTKKVIEGSLRQTALLGHEEVGTDHLLLALLDDPASTGAHILTDLAPAHQRDA